MPYRQKFQSQRTLSSRPNQVNPSLILNNQHKQKSALFWAEKSTIGGTPMSTQKISSGQEAAGKNPQKGGKKMSKEKISSNQMEENVRLPVVTYHDVKNPKKGGKKISKKKLKSLALNWVLACFRQHQINSYLKTNYGIYFNNYESDDNYEFVDVTVAEEAKTIIEYPRDKTLEYITVRNPNPIKPSQPEAAQED